VCLRESQCSCLYHVSATQGKQSNYMCTDTTSALQTIQTCSSVSSCREATNTGNTLGQEISSVGTPASFSGCGALLYILTKSALG